MGPWWQSVWDDFCDLPDLGQALRIAVRLVTAAALGGLLGWQRERMGKTAGLRDHMLVALGAAFFVLVPQQEGMTSADLSRVIQGLVAGIGFLGGGVILKLSEQERVKGVTTAASIWMTAAVGVAVGLGRLASAVLGTVLTYAILAAVLRIERRLHGGESREGQPAGAKEYKGTDASSGAVQAPS